MPTIKLIQGDITTLAVDAIVNAANSALWMGAGVAGAIKRRGGEEIEREAVAKGPIAVGGAVAADAGRLAARYVIHAAAMGPDLVTSEEAIRQATGNALRVAEELGVHSIALPALGTGVGGFAIEDCARIMLDKVIAHLEHGGSLELVIFALFGAPSYEAFRAELAARRLPAGIRAEA